MNPILLLTLSIGIIGSNSLVLSPIAGEVALSYDNRSASDILIASALYGIATAISALILAPQADSYGLRKSLFWSLIAATVGLSASALAPSLIFLCISQSLIGLAAGVALPATYGLAAEIATKGRESETMGKVLTGWTLSLVIGVTLSALIADWLHWRIVFLSMALISGVIAIFVKTIARHEKHIIKFKKTSPLTALYIPGISGALISVAAFMTAFYGLYSFLGAHMQTTLVVPTSYIGLASLAYGIGFGLITPIDRFIDQYGPHRVAPLVFTTMIAAYGLLSIASGTAYILILSCVVWGGVNHLGLNLLVGRLTAIDPTQRASIMGLYSAVTYASMFIGATAFKPIFDYYGFAVIAILSAICIVPALWNSLRPTLHPAD
ncbi:MFS transporter [Amylibacter sp. SFDW26]|uniref:MFS transporter n=1 Tax=Amylibacter sp. SFDW26 TaxID=2652722 RepID=UPI0012626EFD|nr:MFS transporter [Amylibacter sp. SFDW26]KAB7613651.1 MFS transporter [Amylibacter sp. SFDW26]